MKYRIVTGGSAEDVEEDVNRLLKNGWYLAGQLGCTHYGRDRDKPWYTQSMYLVEPDPPAAPADIDGILKKSI